MAWSEDLWLEIVEDIAGTQSASEPLVLRHQANKLNAERIRHRRKREKIYSDPARYARRKECDRRYQASRLKRMRADADKWSEYLKKKRNAGRVRRLAERLQRLERERARRHAKRQELIARIAKRNRLYDGAFPLRRQRAGAWQ